MTEKILVVDDDTSILEGFSEILVENGFAVDKAQDEKEALRSFDARNYNVAIVDISLKETNGLELIEKIRKHSSDAKIIMVTGYPSVKSSYESFRLGANDYLEKPCTEDVLLGAIQRGLQEVEVENKEVVFREHKFDDRVADFNLAELLDDVFETARSSNSNELIHFQHSIDSWTDPYLTGNVYQLTKIISICLNNLKQLTEAGEISLDVIAGRDTFGQCVFWWKAEAQGEVDSMINHRESDRKLNSSFLYCKELIEELGGRIMFELNKDKCKKIVFFVKLKKFSA